ncbi:MAG TPA: nickel pincer cofactor biosynthesis protein LarC [Acidobacteriaceae bacterium]
MRIAYLDCFAGISGDMFLGALLDAGVPLTVLEEAVRALGLGATLEAEKVDRSGIFSTRVQVLEGGVPAEAAAGHTHAHEHEHEHEPAHMHEHTHEHSHAHTHAHQHSGEPAHLHEHAHTREHEHAQTHEHSHEHEHAHEHPHTHEHQHSHEHTHELTHPHEHEQTQSHKHPHQHPHAHGRSLTIIRQLIQDSALAAPVKHFAIHAFELLGASEARIHNVALDQIHFHEVGAVDAIVDIVAASAGIDHLNRQGVVARFCSPVNVGGGMVECAHGTFPVPAPATADLLRNLPTYSAHVHKELVTPTGAALLRALEPTFGTQPPMRVQSIGYGAGTRNPQGFPNVLRLSLGEATTPEQPSPEPIDTTGQAHTQTVTVLETALDDVSPQVLADVAERALAAGALDVMLTPVIMKKGRPGTLITVLSNPLQAEALAQLLLRETTTLGLRIRQEQRSCLDRRHETVSTPYGDLRVKIGSLHGEELNVMPEYEDCRAAAALHQAPIKQVMQAALASYAMANTR